MYCRMCGNLLGDTDRFCKICGARTDVNPPAESAEPILVKEEVVFNPPYEEKNPHHNRFYLVEEEHAEQEEPEAPKEELKEYIPGRNQYAEQEKKTDTEDKRNSEFNWNIHEFPRARKTEEAVFDWEMEGFSSARQKEAAAVAFEEELFQEIRDESNSIKESNIDRFFTFNKKNEEFQKLLDREYEKFNKHSVPITESTAKPQSNIEANMSMEPQGAAEQEIDTEAQAAQRQEIDTEAQAQKQEIDTEPQAMKKQQINTEIVGPKPHPEQDAAADSESETERENKADPLSEMAQARMQFFGEELIKNNETIAKKLAAEDPETQDESQQAEPAEVSNKGNEPAVGMEASEHFSTLEVENLEAAGITALVNAAEPVKSTGPAKSTEPVNLAETADASENADIPGALEITKITETARTLELSEASESSSPTDAAPLKTFVPPDYSEKAEKDQIQAEKKTESFWEESGEEEVKKKNRIGQIVLILIAVVLIAEISILGIRYFAPDSAAADMIDKTQTKVIGTVASWMDGINNLISGKDSKEKVVPDKDDIKEQEAPKETKPENNEKMSQPDPAPMADKAALIASQLGNNINIEQVKANETLSYQEGRDYGLADLNNSKPIENNIWTTAEGGETVYYDQSIAGTIIAFDSQWIDYVNGNGDSVLNLLKKDSKAYKNAVGFSKIGKVKETFKLLEIGEIRQGSAGFYVWVHEEIQITEKGATTDRKYNWIYYLEPVEGKMNIVNYFKFK